MKFQQMPGAVFPLLVSNKHLGDRKLVVLMTACKSSLVTAQEITNIYNNITIRVDDWKIEKSGQRFIICSGRTTYYNSLVTNRVMDYELQDKITVRELLECGPVVKSLKYSLLSNHLGFNGFVESADGEIMFVLRNKSVSIGKKKYGNSVEASLKAKYALNENNRFTIYGLKNGIIREITDELGIEEHELERKEQNNLEELCLIAAYRDMVEGGKPQLLFYTKATVSKKEIEKKFHDKKSSKSKGKNTREENEHVMQQDGDILYWIPRNEMNFWRIYEDKISYNKTELSMVPSSLASFYMLKQFFGIADSATK